MKLTIPHGLGGQLKQLTWLAGRKSTPQEWMRSVWLTRYGAAATDDFCAGWVPSGGHFDDVIFDGLALEVSATDLRSQLKNPSEAGYQVKTNSPVPDRQLLPRLVSDAAHVRRAGQRSYYQPQDLAKVLKSASKQRAERWEFDGLKLHVATAKRVLRQVKAKELIEVWWTDGVAYLQCPVTGVEFLMSTIHPDIDPDRSDADSE